MPDETAPDATLRGVASLFEEQAPDPSPETDEGAESEEEPRTYDAEYVANLKREAIENRHKAKRVTDANARLVGAYAAQDGRLVDASVLEVSDDLLDAEGLVDRERVAEAISSLILAKPYMQNRRPTSAIPQGDRAQAPDEPGLFDMIRGR